MAPNLFHSFLFFSSDHIQSDCIVVFVHSAALLAGSMLFFIGFSRVEGFPTLTTLVRRVSHFCHMLHLHAILAYRGLFCLIIEYFVDYISNHNLIIFSMFSKFFLIFGFDEKSLHLLSFLFSTFFSIYIGVPLFLHNFSIFSFVIEAATLCITSISSFLCHFSDLVCYPKRLLFFVDFFDCFGCILLLGEPYLYVSVP